MAWPCLHMVSMYAFECRTGKWSESFSVSLSFSWLDSFACSKVWGFFLPSNSLSKSWYQRRKKCPPIDVVARDETRPGVFVFQKLEVCVWGACALGKSFPYNIGLLFLRLSWRLVQILGGTSFLSGLYFDIIYIYSRSVLLNYNSYTKVRSVCLPPNVTIRCLWNTWLSDTLY